MRVFVEKTMFRTFLLAGAVAFGLSSVAVAGAKAHLLTPPDEIDDAAHFCESVTETPAGKACDISMQDHTLAEAEATGAFPVKCMADQISQFNWQEWCLRFEGDPEEPKAADITTDTPQGSTGLPMAVDTPEPTANLNGVNIGAMLMPDPAAMDALDTGAKLQGIQSLLPKQNLSNLLGDALK